MAATADVLDLQGDGALRAHGSGQGGLGARPRAVPGAAAGPSDAGGGRAEGERGVTGGGEDERLVLDAIEWCATHRATIRWDVDRKGKRVTVEVLSPVSSWLILRGEGDTLAEAYASVRGQVATARRATR